MRSVHFLSNDGKGASYEGRVGWKSCLFPAKVGIFDFDVMIYKVLFLICTFDLACQQFFPAVEKVKLGEMKVQKRKYIFFVVLMIIPSIVNFLRSIFRNC